MSYQPKSLYYQSLVISARNFTCCHRRRYFKFLHRRLHLDVCYQLFRQDLLSELACEVSDWEIFANLLTLVPSRHLLHRCYQALVDRGYGIVDLQCDSFAELRLNSSEKPLEARSRVIHFGLEVSEFLVEAGWLDGSERMLRECLQLCWSDNGDQTVRLLEVRCYTKLLSLYVHSLNVRKCTEVFYQAQVAVKKLVATSSASDALAELFAVFSMYRYVSSRYSQCYQWSVKSLGHLSGSECKGSFTDVFRSAATACTTVRNFRQAAVFMEFALRSARVSYGALSHKYILTRREYGVFCLTTGRIEKSISILREILQLTRDAFGDLNLNTAVSYQCLAWSLFTKEYYCVERRPRVFREAQDYAKEALRILQHLLPSDHILTASSKNTMAAILESLAVLARYQEIRRKLYEEAEELHLSVISIYRKNLMDSLRCARQYGNLGHLYQTMHRYREAERMYIKGLKMKVELLGPNDYEVAHNYHYLASLYAYELQRPDSAEKLYHMQIAIDKRTFGEGFKDLQLSYAGLAHVYKLLNKLDDADRYETACNRWKELQSTKVFKNCSVTPTPLRKKSVRQIVDDFLKLLPDSIAVMVVQ